MNLTREEIKLDLDLREHGILHPVYTVEVARKEDLELASFCAILMMETGGGRNEFGHDWDFEFAGQEVTEQRYRALRQAIREGRPSNGVGPCQLTSVNLLDDADAIGGAWNIVPNLEVGAHFIHQLQEEHGVLGGFIAYNGSGPAAEAYGNRAMEIRSTFQAVIANA